MKPHRISREWALAAETRFSIRLNDTGEPLAGGAPWCTCQTGLSMGTAPALAARSRL